MSETAMKRYLGMLIQKISSLYGVSIDAATEAVNKSSIQELIRKYPDHVGHVSIYEWAKEVYEEVIVQ